MCGWLQRTGARWSNHTLATRSAEGYEVGEDGELVRRLTAGPGSQLPRGESSASRSLLPRTPSFSLGVRAQAGGSERARHRRWGRLKDSISQHCAQLLGLG